MGTVADVGEVVEAEAGTVTGAGVTTRKMPSSHASAMGETMPRMALGATRSRGALSAASSVGLRRQPLRGTSSCSSERSQPLAQV
jgi:hypothetical protein